jgi:hypothetical protein
MNGHRDFPDFDSADDLRNDPEYERISTQRYQEWADAIDAIPATYEDAYARNNRLLAEVLGLGPKGN